MRRADRGTTDFCVAPRTSSRVLARERARRGLQGVLGPVKYRKHGLTVAVDRVDDRVD